MIRIYGIKIYLDLEKGLDANEILIYYDEYYELRLNNSILYSIVFDIKIDSDKLKNNS